MCEEIAGAGGCFFLFYAITVVTTTPCFLLSPVAPRRSEGILIVGVAAALGVVRPRLLEL